MDELKRVVEPHGEVYYGCPACYGYVQEAEYCDWCGEAHPCEDMDYHSSGAYVCRPCLEEESEDDEDDRDKGQVAADRG